MLRFSMLPVVAIATLSAIAASADTLETAVPALHASSTAAVVNLQFVVNGQKTNTGYEVPATGSAPPAYNKKTVRATYAKTTQILGGLTFKRSAATIQSDAAGHVTAPSTAIASASATVGSFTGTLSSPLGTLATVTTGKISSQATFTQTKTGVTTQGSARIAGLIIDAPALGVHVTYNGTPKVNQVAFHNGDNSIVIFLNRQVTTKVDGKPVAFAVDAVDVQLRNYKIAGSTISGTITVVPTTVR